MAEPASAAVASAVDTASARTGLRRNIAVDSLLACGQSGGFRPPAEVGRNPVEKGREASRLGDQKGDDEGADQDLLDDLDRAGVHRAAHQVIAESRQEQR